MAKLLPSVAGSFFFGRIVLVRLCAQAHPRPGPRAEWQYRWLDNGEQRGDHTTMARPRHPKKEVEDAVRYAEARGWRCTAATAHAWGQLWCPHAFFFNDPATTKIYTLSLHDALPI